MRVLVEDLPKHIGEEVEVWGFLHWRRDLGRIQFLLVRDRTGVVQVVTGGERLPLPESSLKVYGRVVESPKAPGGLEIQASRIEVLSPALEPTPVEIPKEEWRAGLDTLLEYRYVTLRSEKARAPLKVQAALVRGFRRYLDREGFTEVYTPKVVRAGAEGGSGLFGVDYFEERAYLAQSPQLYKQILVGVFERVYEVAPVWRMEEHNTTRHLNEYLSLDVEMGFIESEEEVMALEEALLQEMLEEALTREGKAFALLGAEPPTPPEGIPRLEHKEARRILKEELGYPVGQDLSEEAERLLGQYAKARWGTDWLFITRYPKALRPFYTYPEPDGTSRGFDLLFRGLEITSGGQRIHRYEELVQSLKEKGMDPEAFRGYLEVFKYGMPPHGGFAIGAERLTQKLLGLQNVRQARAFPRDRHRLYP